MAQIASECKPNLPGRIVHFETYPTPFTTDPAIIVLTEDGRLWRRDPTRDIGWQRIEGPAP
jgi:hypothetical protein